MRHVKKKTRKHHTCSFNVLDTGYIRFNYIAIVITSMALKLNVKYISDSHNKEGVFFNVIISNQIDENTRLGGFRSAHLQYMKIMLHILTTYSVILQRIIIVIYCHPFPFVLNSSKHFFRILRSNIAARFTVNYYSLTLHCNCIKVEMWNNVLMTLVSPPPPPHPLIMLAP